MAAFVVNISSLVLFGALRPYLAIWYVSVMVPSVLVLRDQNFFFGALP